MRKNNFKSIYLRTKLWVMPVFRAIAGSFRAIDTLLCIVSLGIFIYQFGFNIADNELTFARSIYRLTFVFYTFRLTASLIRNLIKAGDLRYLLSLLYYFPVLLTWLAGWVLPAQVIARYQTLSFFAHDYAVYFFTAIHVVFGLSRTVTQSLSKHLNPNWLFVGSFLFLIFAGTGLLMLPKATIQPVSFHEALFTSVSAVCVTGLTVVDTATRFSALGKVIIMLLIQAGGIGIMTFTSFFGLFSGSGHSLQNRFIIKNVVNDENGIGQIFYTLRNTITVTLFVEILGAGYLYYAANGQSWHDLWLAGFHSVSAFCNAGFSILPNGLMNALTRDNNMYLGGISALVIIGGMGFPIIFNLLVWLRKKMGNLLRTLSGHSYRNRYVPRVLNTSTVIVLVTTLFLLVSGTLLFFLSERHHVLSGMDTISSLTTAFFMAVTPRTAGFNSFSMSGLMPVTLLWMIVYMWIGASPMSTGGGIKTTTFGIAILNVWNTLRGRDRIEIRHREIAPSSVNRAFVIIFVSVVLIALSTIAISITDRQVPLLSVLFECVSAISTVGLSVDLTPTLSPMAQSILIVLMFVGRIGFFTLLSCFIPQRKNLNYRLPYEHVSIN